MKCGTVMMSVLVAALDVKILQATIHHEKIGRVSRRSQSFGQIFAKTKKTALVCIINNPNLFTRTPERALNLENLLPQ